VRWRAAHAAEGSTRLRCRVDGKEENGQGGNSAASLSQGLGPLLLQANENSPIDDTLFNSNVTTRSYEPEAAIGARLLRP
jgi:hypothetical protein